MFKIISVSVLAVLAFTILLKCKTSKTVVSPTELIENASYTIKKSKCFGTCEEYNMYISKQGIVIENISNINPLGLFSAEFTKQEFEDVVNVFKTNNFADLDSSYLSNLRDIQKIEISHDSKNVVFHERNAPKELKNILKFLEIVAASKDWKK